MKSNEWLEYIVTVNPGYIYDIKSLLDQIKKKEKKFDYIVEKSSAQSPFSNYIIGITPINFKICLDKILELYKSGVISRFINLTLVRKKCKNIILGRIELDRRDINILIPTQEIIDIIEKYKVIDEIAVIRNALAMFPDVGTMEGGTDKNNF